MLSNKNILITGGTGSFGKKFVKTVFENYSPNKVIVYSRDELKQYQMQQMYKDNERIRFFIGDIRDYKRVKMAMEDVNIVIHAAALKHVPVAEYNPFEAVKTNILGSQNIIDASLEKGVNLVVALSTDKAAAPTNLYGATKLAADKLFVAANNYKGKKDIKFSVVRYGNVMGSRGSVIPSFMSQKKSGELTITDEEMTRFNITLAEGVNFVLKCLNRMWGRRTFVPKIPSYKIIDVAKAIMQDPKFKIIGIRPGEKLHEEMITQTDAMNCIDFGDYFVILPSTPLWDVEKFKNESNTISGNFCKRNFSYDSGTNNDFLSVEELKVLIKQNIEK